MALRFHAKFSDGGVSFFVAEFAGGTVRFDSARFSGSGLHLMCDTSAPLDARHTLAWRSPEHVTDQEIELE
jgi:hypothetical protein